MFITITNLFAIAVFGQNMALFEDTTWVIFARAENQQQKAENFLWNNKKKIGEFAIFKFWKHVYQQIRRVGYIFIKILTKGLGVIWNFQIYFSLITSDDSDNEDLVNADANNIPRAKVSTYFFKLTFYLILIRIVKW